MIRLNANTVLLALLTLLFVSFLAYLMIGPSFIPMTDVWRIAWSGTTVLQSELANEQLIVNEIRLPRALLAILVGASLACCGAILQGLFRNALADPSLIGVSSGASMGASFAIVFGAGLVGSSQWLGLSFVSLGAMAGAAISVLFVYRLATNQFGTSVITMLLSGVAISALASALNRLFTYFADNDMLRRINVWEMGNLDHANWERVLIMTAVTLILTLRLPAHASALNAMLLGEAEARYLGIRVEAIKKELILLVAFGTGASVVVAGNIAFVGLIVPHILRLLIGPDHCRLIPASALAGALLLVVADTFSRTVIAPAELPAGILTAMVGAPFFFVLLVRTRVLSTSMRL